MKAKKKPDVQPPPGWDGRKSRKRGGQPMLEVLFYTTLTCTQTDAIMLKIENNINLSNTLKVELVETLKDSAPECSWYWDAND